MRRATYLLCLLFLSPVFSTAQIFVLSPTPVIGGEAFQGLWAGSIAVADIDNDGDIDIVITGLVDTNNMNPTLTKLYRNQGEGMFIEVQDTPFEGIAGGSAAFADVDMDGDQDLMLIGLGTYTGAPHYVTELYINDGTGNFSVKEDTPLPHLAYCTLAFADIDADNDPDLMLSGTDESFSSIAKLYRNDGKGNFTEEVNTPFERVNNSSVSFVDIDNDDDLDLIMTGETSQGSKLNIYTNDGNGNYTDKKVNLKGGWDGALAFADIDQDNDQDLMVMGEHTFSEYVTQIYVNDGEGNFSESKGQAFDPTAAGDIKFSDIDLDGDQDLVMMGHNSFGRYMKLYINDGDGKFSEEINMPFENVAWGKLALVDIDGDLDNDLLVSGLNGTQKAITKLYINTTNTPTSVPALPLEASASLQIVPNPSNRPQVSINYMSESVGEIDIGLSNIGGRRILHQRSSVIKGANSFMLDSSNIEPGVYILELIQEEIIIIARLVVE